LQREETTHDAVVVLVRAGFAARHIGGAVLAGVWEMSEWKVGDLALCVNVNDALRPEYLRKGIAGRFLRVGAVYIVAGIRQHAVTAELILYLDHGKSGGAFRFRKIEPLTEDDIRGVAEELRQDQRISAHT
jgi:hypothetical protein